MKHSLSLACSFVPIFVDKWIKLFRSARTIRVVDRTRSRSRETVDPVKNWCEDLPAGIEFQYKNQKETAYLPSNIQLIVTHKI